MRLVLDTNVVVAAMRSPAGASAELLRMARRLELQLVVSVPLAVEYESQCTAATHWLAAGLTAEEAVSFVTAVIALCEPAPIRFLWRPQLRDPGDEMVLEAAINGRADALVSFNRRDFGDAPSRFGLDVLLPREVPERKTRTTDSPPGAPERSQK